MDFESFTTRALDEIRDDVRCLRKKLSDPKFGILIRLDRLEQVRESQKYLIRAILGAIIVQLAAAGHLLVRLWLQ